MKHRDRLIAAGAVVIIAALAAAVVILVLGAQRAGIETREELRLEQINTEAERMEALIQASFSSQAGSVGAPGTFNLVPRDPEDLQRLTPRDPEARTGQVLVDLDGTIINGSLLRDDALIGTELEREGLERVLGGEAAVLPMAPGATTTRPVISVAVPVRDEAGRLAGAMLSETEVAPDSVFNLFIAGFSTGETISMSYVDPNGVVIASSDHGLLAKPLTEQAVTDFEPGFHRADDKVAAVAHVPSALWDVVFLQDIDEFQGDLTGPLQTAVVLFLAVVAGISVFTVVALLRRLQAAREEERRLREIGEAREEFTSIVSHELRTPVAGLLGFLQTTIDHWDAMGDQERRRAVSRAFTNARALQTLTSDVLDSASIEAQTLTYRFDAIDLSTCVADAIETTQETLPDRVITFSKPDTPTVVRADALRIRQVLGNLLDNATKSSAPDSPIDVDVTVTDGIASVSVRDRGPGIAHEERERIFEKFTRGRAGVGRGTGLGLYISRHIIEAHDGHISAESLQGEPGARITFTLPLSS